MNAVTFCSSAGTGKRNSTYSLTHLKKKRLVVRYDSNPIITLFKYNTSSVDEEHSSASFLGNVTLLFHWWQLSLDKQQHSSLWWPITRLQKYQPKCHSRVTYVDFKFAFVMYAAEILIICAKQQLSWQCSPVYNRDCIQEKLNAKSKLEIFNILEIW